MSRDVEGLNIPGQRDVKVLNIPGQRDVKLNELPEQILMLLPLLYVLYLVLIQGRFALLYIMLMLSIDFQLNLLFFNETYRFSMKSILKS